MPNSKRATDFRPIEPLRTLYVCYFGLREPLVQTQVLPYLRQLKSTSLRVSLLTFEPRLREKWSKTELTKQREQLAADGITWFSLPYHKSPSIPATLYDIMNGARFAVQLARREGIQVLHARAHVPMAMAMLARRITGCRLIFDIRGLVADEYVDAGIWKENSLPFKAVKAVERKGIRSADQIIVLTERMRSWLLEHCLAVADRVEVIPCCFDFSRFRDENDAKQSEERLEVVYAGSVTGLYMLEEMGRFFLKLREQHGRAFFRVLTVSSPLNAYSILRGIGLDDGDFSIVAVRPEEVPTHLRRAQLGLSFRKLTFSQIAASPTKIAEYLAAGLPVVSTAGVGDVDDLLETERVGVVVSQFDDESYTKVATRALAFVRDPDIRTRCARVALERFDLITIGGAGYRNVYQRLEERALSGNSEPESAPQTPVQI